MRQLSFRQIAKLNIRACSGRSNALVHRKTFISACLLLFVSLTQVALADTPQPPLPTVEFKINNVLLTAEIAATPQQRYMGLSFRKALNENSGMLFVYPSEQQLTFTMRNTLIPLSIAFLSKDLVISEIQHMDVGPGQLFPSKYHAQYALEVDQGWFADNGIKAGDQLVRQP